MLLGVVAHRHAAPPLHRADDRFGDPGQHPQQRGLARAVEAHDHDPVAPAGVERDVFEHVEPGVAHGQVVGLQHRAGAVRRSGQAQLEHLARLHGLGAVLLEPVDALLEAVGHGGLGGLGAEAVDDVLQALDLLGLHGDLLRQAHLVGLTGVRVLRVRALVLVHGAGAGVCPAVEVDHAGDGLVEQVQVVADHDEGAPVARQEVQHPELGVGVEVVGGLVEQQHVGPGEEDAHHLDPAALPTREGAQREVELLVGQPDACRQAAHLGLGGVAAVHAELLQRSGVALDVARVRVGLHGHLELVDAVQLPRRSPGR